MPSIPKPTSLERIDSTSNLASSGTTIHPHVKVISVQHVNKPKSNSQTKNRSEKILKKLDSEIENSKGNTNNERKHKEDLQRIKYWVERAQVGEVSDESHYEEVFINEVDRCLGQGRKTYIEQKARELILQIKAYDVEGGIRPNRLNTSAGGVALRILSVFSGHLFPEPMVLDSARNGSVSTSPSLPFGGQPRIQPSPQNAMKMKTIKVESSVSPVEQDVNVVASRQNSSPALGKSTAAPLSGYKYGKEIATHLMATENNMHGHQGNLELIKETLENYTENLMTFEGGEIVENTEVREKIQNLFSSISIEDIEELENQAVETAIDEDTDDESVIDSHTRQKRSLPSGRKRKDYGGIEEHFVKRINEKMERKDISIHRKRIFVKKKLAQIKINVLRLNTLQEKGIKVSKPRIIHLNFKQKFLQSKLDQLVAFKKSKSTFSNLLDLWNGELDKNALNELSTELSELRANFINQLSILSVSSTDRENDPLPFNNTILVLNENIAILSNLLQLVSKLPYFNDAKSLKILNERSIEWQSLDNNFRKLIKKISKSGIDSINTTSAIRKLKSLNYFIDEQIQETKNYVNTCTDALFVGWLGEKNRQGATPLYFNRESLYRDIIEFKSKMAVQDSIDERTRNSLEIESLVMKSLPSTELTEVELSNTAAALYLTSRIYDIKKTDPHAVENIDIDKFIFSDLIYSFSDHLGRIKYDVISVVDYLCSEATNHPILKRKQVSVSWPSEVHDNLLIFLNEEKVNVTKFLRFMEKQSSVEANKDKLLSSIETPMSYFQHTLDRLAVNEPGVALSNTVTYRYTVFSHHPEAHSVAMRENPPVKKSFSIADILTGRERAWRAENTAYNEREIINTSGISNSLLHSLENTDTQAEFLRSMKALRSDLQIKERFYDYAKSALELHQLDINHSYSIREAPMLLIYPSPEDGPHFSKKWSYDLNPEYSPIKLFSLLTNKVLIFASINDFKRQIRVNTELREWVQLHFPAEFHGNYDQMTIDKKGMDYSNLFERTIDKYSNDMDVLVSSHLESAALGMLNRIEKISHILALPAVGMGTVAGFLYGTTMSIGPLLGKAAISDTEEERNKYLKEVAISVAIELVFEGGGKLIGTATKAVKATKDAIDTVANNFFKHQWQRKAIFQSLDMPSDIVDVGRLLTNNELENALCSRVKRAPGALCTLLRKRLLDTSREVMSKKSFEAFAHIAHEQGVDLSGIKTMTVGYRKANNEIGFGAIGKVYQLDDNFVVKDYSGNIRLDENPARSSLCRLYAARNTEAAFNRLYGEGSAEVILHDTTDPMVKTVSVKMKKIHGDSLSNIIRNARPELSDVVRKFKEEGIVNELVEYLRSNGIDHNDINLGNILYDPHTGKFALIDFDSAQIIPVVGESLSAGKVKTIRQNLNHVFNEAERALKSSQSSVLSDLDEVSGNSWGSMLERIPIIGNIIQVRNIKRSLANALPIAKSKLDNTLSAMDNTALNDDVRLAQDVFFGKDFYDDPSSQERLRSIIEAMRSDTERLSVVNFDIGNQIEGSSVIVAALSRSEYAKFGLDQRVKFIKVNKRGFNQYYQKMGKSDRAVADVLIHELSHGAPNSLDFVYVGTKKQATGYVDIYELANLANDKIEYRSDSIGLNPTSSLGGPHLRSINSISGKKGIRNADSIAQYVSLFDKFRSNFGGFDIDMKTLRTLQLETNDFSQRAHEGVRVNRMQRSIVEKHSRILVAIDRDSGDFDLYVPASEGALN